MKSSPPSESPLRKEGDDVLVSIFAKPRAARSRIVGARVGALEIQLAAPPLEGEANRELREFLAKTSGHPRSRIVLERGEKDRHKLVRFVGADFEEITRSLLAKVAEGAEEH